MRSLLTIVAFLALSIPACFAQAAPAPLPANVYAAGGSFNNNGSPRVAVTALYARLVANEGTYAFTVFDVLPTNTNPLTVTSNIGAGVAQKVFTIGKVGIYVPATAGLTWTGTNMGWNYSTGGMASVKLYGNLRVFPTVRVQKNNLGNGTGFQPIIGVMIGYAK